VPQRRPSGCGSPQGRVLRPLALPCSPSLRCGVRCIGRYRHLQICLSHIRFSPMAIPSKRKHSTLERAGPISTMFRAARMVPWNELRKGANTAKKRFREVKKQFEPRKKQKKDNKKPVKQSFINAHISVSRSAKINKVTPSAKLYKKLSLLSTYGDETLSGAQSQPGSQFANAVYHTHTSTDLQNIHLTITNNVVLDATRQVKQLHVKDCTVTTTFTNQGTTNTVMYIWDVISRTDDGTLRDPVTDWSNGYAEQLWNSVAYATPTNIVGNMPTDVTNFKTLWTVIGKHKLILAPGQNHIHKFYFALNKILTEERWTTIAQIRGQTTACFVFGHGTPVDDSPVRATIGNVQTAACKIIWHTQQRYRASVVTRDHPGRINQIVSSMPAPSAALYQIDDDDGDVEQIRAAGVDTGFA